MAMTIYLTILNHTGWELFEKATSNSLRTASDKGIVFSLRYFLLLVDFDFFNADFKDYFIKLS